MPSHIHAPRITYLVTKLEQERSYIKALGDENRTDIDELMKASTLMSRVVLLREKIKDRNVAIRASSKLIDEYKKELDVLHRSS